MCAPKKLADSTVITQRPISIEQPVIEKPVINGVKLTPAQVKYIYIERQKEDSVITPKDSAPQIQDRSFAFFDSIPWRISRSILYQDSIYTYPDSGWAYVSGISDDLSQKIRRFMFWSTPYHSIAFDKTRIITYEHSPLFTLGVFLEDEDLFHPINSLNTIGLRASLHLKNLHVSANPQYNWSTHTKFIKAEVLYNLLEK